MIVVGGWPGRNVVGLNGRFGVRPADFSTGGDFPNPFLNDVDGGDETTEFLGVVQSLPSSGVVDFNDLGGFSHTGAADGTYSTVFTLYTWAQGGPVTQHAPNETITTNFGGTSATASGATLTAIASVIAGAASASANGTAAGAALEVAASMLAGGAAANGNASAAGATLAAAAALLAGAAAGQTNASAAGALLQAQAALLAGAAEAGDSATAAGALLQAVAAMLPGAAFGQASATAAGATFTAYAALIAGGAFGPINRGTPGYSAKAESAPRRATIKAQTRTARRTLQ